MNVSFAVTAFRETAPVRGGGERLRRCLDAPSKHEAIGEIVVVDDASEDFEKLQALLQDVPKVRLYRNAENRGVFGNKVEAVARSRGEWVINADSDNTMDAAYIDRALVLMSDPQVWHSPSFARPNFDYRHLVGLYRLEDIHTILDAPRFDCLLNTGNQVVHRGGFMATFQKYRGRRFDLMQPNHLGLTEKEHQKHYWRLVWDACDSFFFNMEWLSAGGRLHVAEGLEYDHHYSGGADSNYARAPEEKGQLADALKAELRRRSEKCK